MKFAETTVTFQPNHPTNPIQMAEVTNAVKRGMNTHIKFLNKKTPKIVIPKIGEKRKKIELCIKNSKLQINRIMLSKKRRKEFRGCIVD